MNELIGFLLVFGILWILYKFVDRAAPAETTSPPRARDTEPGDTVYLGASDGISLADINRILLARHSYYIALEPRLRQRFARRCLQFMRTKIFVIKTGEAYREMPVMLSAAAIQLSFGLRSYLLPFYRYIRIRPKEYIATHSLKVLAGNVQNNTITVAWNHFLHGYANSADGSNLGLHEMSHALYCQELIVNKGGTSGFSKNYRRLIAECHQAHHEEKTGRKNLYSEYAETDLQEFWAESVELFFEKPMKLREQHPDVYAAMEMVLNQDPLSPSRPVKEPNLPFARLSAFFR